MPTAAGLIRVSSITSEMAELSHDITASGISGAAKELIVFTNGLSTCR